MVCSEYMKEREFVDIRREDVPAVFELSVANNGITLLVSVHSEIAGFIEDITSKPDPRARSLRTELGIPNLIPFSPNRKIWGFGNVLVLADSQRPGWVTWRCNLPKGAGEITQEQWQQVYAISATLNLLSIVVNRADKDRGDTVPQLFELHLITKKQDYGGGLEVSLARAFIPWISAQDEQVHHPKVEPYMKAAFEHMWLKYKEIFHLYDSYFARFEKPKWVSLIVPGNACGLTPDDDHFLHTGSNRGYRLRPHNTDNPFQQIALLMGIAAMHDEARKTPSNPV